MTFVDRERQILSAALEAAGADAPTLCEGWDAYDLAAHLWVRESQAARFGLALMRPGARMEMLLRAAKQSHTFAQLIADFKTGPKGLSPFRFGPVNSLGNVIEFFVHTEDVRRSGPRPLSPRPLPPADEAVLVSALARMGRLMLRKLPFGIDFVLPSGQVIPIKKDRKVAVHGSIGELVLFASGRREVAQVEVAGSPENQAALVKLGI